MFKFLPSSKILKYVPYLHNFQYVYVYQLQIRNYIIVNCSLPVIPCRICLFVRFKNGVEKWKNCRSKIIL